MGRTASAREEHPGRRCWGSHPQGRIRQNQRRWVENTLPAFELLDAVAIAYGRLSLLVDDAHDQLGLPKPKAVHIQTGEAYPEGERGDGCPA